MKLSKIASLLMVPVLALSLAACSAPKDDASDAASGDAQTAELVAQKPAGAEEAAELFQQLMQKENEIFASDSALWEKVFLAANKDAPMIEDGKNYGDFLIATIENAKGEFSDDEYTLIKGEAEKIRDIENKLTELENRFPEINKTSGDDEMSMPAGNADMTKFPSFTGKDQVGSRYSLTEVQHVEHQADTRFQLGIQERKETSAHSSGCPGSGDIRNVFASSRQDNP